MIEPFECEGADEQAHREADPADCAHANDLFVAASRAILLQTGVIGSLVLYWLVRWTPLRFLFERPRMFWLKDKPGSRVVMQPAE